MVNAFLWRTKSHPMFHSLLFRRLYPLQVPRPPDLQEDVQTWDPERGYSIAFLKRWQLLLSQQYVFARPQEAVRLHEMHLLELLSFFAFTFRRETPFCSFSLYLS